MEIERNVILDLLPMYLADEVSPETRELVDKYLETDQDLARFAQKQKEVAVLLAAVLGFTLLTFFVSV